MKERARHRVATLVLVLLTTAVILSGMTSAALATVYNGYVHNGSTGAKGVKADVNAAVRHEYGEDYYVQLRTSDGAAWLALTLVRYTNDSTFTLKAIMHYRYASDNPYEYSRDHTETYSGSYIGWHNLKIAHNTGGYYKVYIDDTIKDWYVGWPYTSGIVERTAADGAYVGGTLAQYLSHHSSIYLQTSSGTWSLQTSGSWGPYISTYISSPYYFTYQGMAYYDWMGQRY